MDPIGTLAPGLLAHLARQPGIALPLLRRLWPRMVGAPLCERTAPAALGDGLLTVEVEEQGWLRELEPLRERWRLKLNQTLGEGTIKAIRLVLRSPPR
jgi:hypothetical protein